MSRTPSAVLCDTTPRSFDHRYQRASSSCGPGTQSVRRKTPRSTRIQFVAPTWWACAWWE
jgi:hypothetical protein